MSFLLDTNACIALLKGTDADLAKRLRVSKPEQFKLCSPVKAELFYGARKSERVNDNLALLTKFFEPFESFTFDDSAAEQYGIVRAILSRSGNPIGSNDLLIASIALAHDLTLLTKNLREFVKVPGLRTESW